MTDPSDEARSGAPDGPRPICEIPLDDEPPTTRVLEAVAAASDVPPLQVTPRLSEVFDPDALDRLFAAKRDGSARSDGFVDFEMGSWHVQVNWGDDCVRVFDGGE